MKVFKILLVKNRGLHSLTSIGKRIRYSTKRVNVPPMGYNEHLYSFKTLYFAKEFLEIFTMHNSKRKYVIYEAVAITPLRDNDSVDRGFVLSRKLKLVRRVKSVNNP